MPRPAVDEHALTERIIELAREYGRYGYRRVTALPWMEGWSVNPKRVHRIWRREGPKVPRKQPKRARLCFNDGSCLRLRPEHKDHVWAYDFVHHRTHEGRAFRLLTIVDEYTGECLAIEVERKLDSESVLEFGSCRAHFSQSRAWQGFRCVSRGLPLRVTGANGLLSAPCQ